MSALRPLVAVVIHDAGAPTWDACLRLRRCIAEIAPLPVTWLVVPRYHGAGETPAFVQGLAEAHAQGDELALHGLTHQDPLPPPGGLDRLVRRGYTAGEGEFAGLSRDQATQRLRTGRAWFAAHGWQPRGFIAPAWLLGEGAWQAVSEQPFDYTCTLAHLVALPSRRRWRSQSIVYSTRSAWRRVLSNRWAGAAAWWERGNPLLRFELHPPDAEHASTRRSWMRLLERALREREPVTLGNAAKALCA